VRTWAGLVLGGALGLRAPTGVAARRCRDKEWSERQIVRIIKQAAKRYDQSPKKMVRVARCESNLDPCAVNPAGPYRGLFQFLDSTWRSTPYRHDNVYDPKANALAAAWMWREGRRDEWTC
jgi:soluble lytic murein transglycosylase-like protein